MNPQTLDKEAFHLTAVCRLAIVGCSQRMKKKTRKVFYRVSLFERCFFFFFMPHFGQDKNILVANKTDLGNCGGMPDSLRIFHQEGATMNVTHFFYLCCSSWRERSQLMMVDQKQDQCVDEAMRT